MGNVGGGQFGGGGGGWGVGSGTTMRFRLQRLVHRKTEES